MKILNPIRYTEEPLCQRTFMQKRHSAAICLTEKFPCKCSKGEKPDCRICRFCVFHTT